jgi:predicted O-methyltransferase YrrM
LKKILREAFGNIVRNKKVFNDEYYKRLDYIRDLYGSAEDELLESVRMQSAFAGFPITINPEEGQILSMLISVIGAKKVLELGTLFGYSTIWLARAIGDDGKITTIERDADECKIAERNFKSAGLSNVNLICGDAIKELEKMDELYDVFFIDADKNAYVEYLKFADKLVKKGGLIIADNTMLSGAVCVDYLPEKIRFSTQRNVREFNRLLADKNKYHSILLNNEEGMSIAVKL